MGKTIALTGAAGYLGTVLIDYLRAQPWVDRIIALDVKPAPADGRVISYLCDVRDGDFLRALFTEHAVSHVIHAAFIITPPRNMSPTEMHNANVEGSQAVIRAAFESHTRQLVFIS